MFYRTVKSRKKKATLLCLLCVRKTKSCVRRSVSPAARAVTITPFFYYKILYKSDL